MEEQGFNLCSDNGTLVDSDQSSGDLSNVYVNRKCSNEKQTPKVGDYHTHPMGTHDMSSEDMLGACTQHLKCIGSTKDDTIRCFVRKSDKRAEQCTQDTKRIFDESGIIEQNAKILNRELEKIKIEFNAPGIDTIKYNNKHNKKVRDHQSKAKLHNSNVDNFIKRRNEVSNKYFTEIAIKH